MRKKAALLAFFVSVVLSVNAFAAAATAKFITGDDLQAMMKDGKQLAIIDVRDHLYYRKGHIPGSINVSSDEAYNKRAIVFEYNPQDRVVIVGYGGTTGQEIIDMFLAYGFQNVYGLEGGMREWKGPVVEK